MANTVYSLACQWSSLCLMISVAHDEVWLREVRVSHWPHRQFLFVHYIDGIMTTMASQITSLTVVYSTVYSDADQRKHQSSALLAFVWVIHRGRWFPRTKGQLRGKCFHLMTSSWVLLKSVVYFLSFRLADVIYSVICFTRNIQCTVNVKFLWGFCLIFSVGVCFRFGNFIR